MVFQKLSKLTFGSAKLLSQERSEILESDVFENTTELLKRFKECKITKLPERMKLLSSEAEADTQADVLMWPYQKVRKGATISDGTKIDACKTSDHS